jgi:Lon-like protease
MTRRTTSLVAAGAVLAVLLLVSFKASMPYVVMSPGLTENTLGSVGGDPVIEIAGHKTYPTSGHFDLTTVSVTSPDYQPRLTELLSAWWDKDEIVIPRDIVYPPEKSVSQVEQENKQEMDTSQNSAIAAGLGEAGIRSAHVRIGAVEKGAPAEGVLQKGDVIVSVDGAHVDSIDEAVADISKVDPGSQVQLVVARAGEQQPVTLRTVASQDDDSKSRIGVQLAEDVNPPFSVNITLGQDIGGPSAGMMFALAIYDKITPGKLTGGRFIAGTGEITSGGTVGVIGGIQQKIAGAHQAGATVFLVPAGNCDEAAKSPLADDVRLVKVATLDDAVHALKALKSGDDSAVASCTG